MENSGIDSDMWDMSVEDLKLEAQKLRDAIRNHRDQKGHDRCWLDDTELYAALPEQKPEQVTLPPREEFLAGCSQFWATRQCPTSLDLHAWGGEPMELAERLASSLVEVCDRAPRGADVKVAGKKLDGGFMNRDSAGVEAKRVTKKIALAFVAALPQGTRE